jgi:hypothetical protein
VTSTWVWVALVVVALAVWYFSFLATRLDRLHARVEGAAGALDAQLVRRSSTALQLATSGVLDPASALLLAGAAHEAREAEGTTGPDREQAESDLTRALHAVLGHPAEVAALEADPTGRGVLAELAVACHRATLARRFHNDAVRAARVVRRKRVVRLLRLAGHAAWPASFEADDSVPLALTAPV